MESGGQVLNVFGAAWGRLDKREKMNACGRGLEGEEVRLLIG